MSISGKIQIAQEKVDDIFQLLRDYNVETSNENNLINLENDLANYFNQRQFTLIDYAYASGNQYLDTGIQMQNNIAVELKFILEDDIDGESFGGFVAGEKEFNILKNNNGNFESSVTLDDTYIVDSVDDGIHSLVYNTYGRRLLFDGMQKTFIRNIEPTEERKNLLIFANAHDGAKPTGRLYNCKIYDISTGTILRFFVPVIDNNDTVCFFDIVTQEFYYSQGDEEFY